MIWCGPVHSDVYVADISWEFPKVDSVHPDEQNLGI